MASCVVCYSSFSEDNLPRRLNCYHILCTQCLKNDFIDGILFCPECYVELKSSSQDINEISNEISLSELLNIDEGSTDDSNEDVMTINYDSANVVDSMRNTLPRNMCTFPNCTNKSFENEFFCMKHCGNSKDLTEVNQIASDLQNATFNIKTTRNNKIEPIAKKELNADDLKAKFIKQKRIDLGDAMDLIDRAKDIMLREPNILFLEAPVLAVGDIHGQFFDLLNLLEEGGPPGNEQYLFLGDYVDRGSWSCEVMFYLLSLKISYPDKIWLLRGNHECATVSGHFGFKQECKIKYGMNVYYRFLLLFQVMPLCAVISTAYGEIFACHVSVMNN